MNATTQKNVVMVSVSASMFGGYKRTSESDIVAAGGKIPETTILTKGGKHIFPTEKLSVFGTIKKAVFRELWKVGVKSFGSGSVIAICEDDLDEVEKTLDAAKVEFEAALVHLRQNYDMWLGEYIQAQPNPAAADIIRNSALTADDACSRFGFSYDTFMPTPVGKNGSVESMAAKLTSQLYDEVAQAAKDAWDKTFCPNGVIRTVGQKAKSPLRNCRDKLQKLSFLDPNVLGAVELIDSVLATTQQTGYIEDEPSNPCAKRLRGLVALMTDAGGFSAAAEKMVKSADKETDMEVLCGIQSLWDDTVTADPLTAQFVESIAQQSETVEAAVGEVAEPKAEAPAKKVEVKPAAKAIPAESFFF